MKGRKMPYVKGLITVIVPTLNCAMSIDRCVESILNQTWKELEVVCVDACSTDGTKELLQKYEEKDKRVKVIVSDRKSYGYQMNLGISCASGEYIGIVESDDEVEPDMYEQLYSAAILYTPDMVRSDYCETYIGENGVREKRLVPILHDKSQYDKCIGAEDNVHCLNPDAIATWSGLYRRDFLIQKGIVYNDTEGASFQDIDFWAQTNFFAQKSVYINAASYLYRIDNPDSSTFQKNKAFCISEEFRYVMEKLAPYKTTDKAGMSERICWIFYRKYKRNLERVSEELLKDFYIRFAEDFRLWKARFDLRYLYFYEEERSELENIMSDPCLYLEKILETRSDFIEGLKKIDRLAIYGAGRVGKKLASKVGNRVAFFAGSNIGDSREIMGIPIVDIHGICEADKAILLVVATKRADFRSEMLETATASGFQNVVAIPYGAFEW